MMKFSTHMLAGLGLIAAAGLITPAFAASTGMSDVGGAAKQSSMSGGSAQQGPSSGAQSGTMSPTADASQSGAANLSQKDIMQVQQALSSQGEKVSSDGHWGPGTVSALKHFQQKNGLPATGQLDDATKSKLNLNG